MISESASLSVRVQMRVTSRTVENCKCAEQYLAQHWCVYFFKGRTYLADNVMLQTCLAHYINPSPAGGLTCRRSGYSAKTFIWVIQHILFKDWMMFVSLF